MDRLKIPLLIAYGIIGGVIFIAGFLCGFWGLCWYLDRIMGGVFV